MTWRQLLAAHRGAVEQRWAETAWTLAVLASLNPFRGKDQTFEVAQFNPLRIAEGNTDKPAVRRRGGLPLDPETIRAYHAVLVKRGKTGKSGQSGPAKRDAAAATSVTGLAAQQ